MTDFSVLWSVFYVFSTLFCNMFAENYQNPDMEKNSFTFWNKIFSGQLLMRIIILFLLFFIGMYGYLRYENERNRTKAISDLNSIIDASLKNRHQYSGKWDSSAYRLDVKKRLDSLNLNLKKGLSGKTLDTAWVNSLLLSTTTEFQSRKDLMNNTQTAMELSSQLLERYERMEEATSIFDNTIGILEMVALLFSIGAAIILFRFGDDLKKVEEIRDRMQQEESKVLTTSKTLTQIREKELWQSITTRNPIYLGIHLDSQIQHLETFENPGKDIQFMLGSLYYAKAHESGDATKYDKAIEYFGAALNNPRSTDRQLREELIHLYIGLV
ncbi:MAG: hypothetical protein IT269_09740 [Saprospiraceae bacterium]|nr:hypothetical protein [Saprospiraceae bacterium]